MLAMCRLGSSLGSLCPLGFFFPLSSFFFSCPAPTMTQSVLLWTLPEASDHALPHIYNEPSPRPHLGAVNVLSFIHFPLHFFVLAIEEVKPGPGTCYAEVLLIVSPVLPR